MTEERKQAIRAGFENWGLLEAPQPAFFCSD